MSNNDKERADMYQAKYKDIIESMTEMYRLRREDDVPKDDFDDFLELYIDRRATEIEREIEDRDAKYEREDLHHFSHTRFGR